RARAAISARRTDACPTRTNDLVEAAIEPRTCASLAAARTVAHGGALARARAALASIDADFRETKHGLGIVDVHLRIIAGHLIRCQPALPTGRTGFGTLWRR